MTATRRSAVALALVVASAAAMSACTTAPESGTAPEDGRSPSTAPADATLRSAAPGDLLVGSAVAGGGHHTSQDYPDPFASDEQYRALLAAEFSSLTPENQLKWEFVHPQRDEYEFGPADEIIDFAEQNGQAVRGHTLLWHSQNPAWLEDLEVSDDELRELLHEHISAVVGRYAGRIAEWDVANELFTDEGVWRTENPWVARLGEGIVADAFRWAHEADPDALLFLNDYSIETAGAKSDAVLALARELVDQDVPIGGIGVQGHLSMQYPEPAGMAANLQRFADLGLAVAITELDVRMPLDGEPTDAQLAQQAEWFALVLDACLSTGACSSVTVWGATDKYSWVPVFFPDEGAATPWWDDLTRKPAYDALWERLGG